MSEDSVDIHWNCEKLKPMVRAGHLAMVESVRSKFVEESMPADILSAAVSSGRLQMIKLVRSWYPAGNLEKKIFENDFYCLSKSIFSNYIFYKCTY